MLTRRPAYQARELWFMPWQVPLHLFVLAVNVTGLAGANTTSLTPFTCEAGPTIVAFVEGSPVPEAMPLWQSEQLRLLPMCVE